MLQLPQLEVICLHSLIMELDEASGRDIARFWILNSNERVLIFRYDRVLTTFLEKHHIST